MTIVYVTIKYLLRLPKSPKVKVISALLKKFSSALPGPFHVRALKFLMKA